PLPFPPPVFVAHAGPPDPRTQRLPLAGGRVEAVAVPDEHAADDTWSVRQADRRGRRGRRLFNCLKGVSARLPPQGDQVHTHTESARGRRGTLPPRLVVLAGDPPALRPQATHRS